MKFFDRKPFDISKNRTVNQKAAFSGIMMSITLLFQYIERYVPLNLGMVNINLSFLFILPIFYLSGFLFGFSSMIIRFLVGPLFAPTGYATMIVFTNLLITETILIGLIYFFSLVFYKKNDRLFYTLTLSFISILIISPVLNGLVFFPILLMVLTDIDKIDAEIAAEGFDKFRGFFFGIRNYWGGMFATYGTLAAVTYGTIFSIYYPMSKIYYEIGVRHF